MRAFDEIQDASDSAEPFLSDAAGTARSFRRWRLARICCYPKTIALLIFGLCYLMAFSYCRTKCARDPTSFFFNPDLGYTPRYSATRQTTANSFVDVITKEVGQTNATDHLSKKKMCVGMASVARENARYFRTAVGSLLEGLSADERREIHLILFIAHTDPKVHPAYAEPWFWALPDQVLAYELTNDELEHIKQLEQDKGLFREKALFDYTYLLKACSKIDAPYVAMVEDDVLAMDGWYHRTMKGLKTAELQTRRKGALHFLYLRLFYTEEFLGWNSEDWPTYLFWSVITAGLPAVVLLGIRRRFTKLQPVIPNQTIGVVSLFYIPLCIVLYFMCGKVSMQPLPAGVNEMARFGCCSQAFVFQQSRVPDLIEYYSAKKIGFVDMLTEELADRDNEIRWALTPNVMQHIGGKSSKGDDFSDAAKHDRSVAEKIWNFAYEDNDADALRLEHQSALQTDGR